MGPDDDAGGARLHVEQGRPAVLRRQRAGEQHDPRGLVARVELDRLRLAVVGEQRRGLPRPTERAEHRPQRPGVLRGEHLGGREQDGLPPGVDDLQHRPQRHHRLARPDVALQQPVQRTGPAERLREIGADLAAARRSARTAGARRTPPRVRPPRAGTTAPTGRRPRASPPAARAAAPSASSQVSRRIAGFVSSRVAGRWMSRSARPSPTRPWRRRISSGTGSSGSSNTSRVWRTAASRSQVWTFFVAG